MTPEENLMMNPQIARELELEAMSTQLGADRYRKQRPLPWRNEAGGTKEEAELAPGRELMKRTIEPVRAAIDDLVSRRRDGKAGRGRPSVAVRYLVHLDSGAVAFMAARRIINGAAERQSMTATALGVASMLEDHFKYEQFAAQEPGLYKHTLRKLSKVGHGGHRRGVLAHALKLTGVKGLEWNKREMLLVGLKLIEFFIEGTGIVESYTERRGKKTQSFIRFSEKAAAWLEAMHERCALLSPLCLPMVVPPAPWTNPLDGGYLNRHNLKFPMVKLQRRDTLDELFSADMPEVYDALNAIQSTPWRINRGVADVAREAWAIGLEIAGLPAAEDEQVPPRPAHIREDVPMKDLPEDQKQLIGQWAERAKDVYAANARRRGKRYSVLQQLWVADTLRDDAEIYFPHTLDFRGRIYPVPPLVNPQADDLGRAVLEFAHGKPLGTDGVYWLAIHVANTFGFDKAPLSDRVAWVLENEGRILEAALRPLDGDRWWTEADKPWSFLAGCLEWAGYRIAGPEFVSHLPCQVDGTCSGLQHYSALLRDPVGGAAVNLVPGETKADIYATVAEKVEGRLTGDEDDFARAWTGKVSRQIVKRPTMTFPYSVTERGMKTHIADEIDNDYLGLPARETFAACGFLAKLVREEIRGTVIAAATAMDFLQNLAAVAAKNGLPIRWTSPVGLPVLQDARINKTEQVAANIAGVRQRLNLSVETTAIDKAKQRNGIAPNYVHSLDAAHLMRTVNHSVVEGVDNFSMIHDSFGTHACDVPMLNAVLREEFVEMYSIDRLTMLRDEVLAQLPPELASEVPPVPPAGDLELDAVRDSAFFFS